MQEPEKPVKVKGKDQIEYDADMASNAALIEEWDTIEARIDVDAQLAKRLQAKEREQMHVKERARLLMEFITARKKFFAAKRTEEQRKKPPTKAEQRKKMYTYMKHMASYPIQEGLRAELKACLEIVPGDDSAVSIESLATKYLIVDCKTQILAEDKIYYQIIRADGSTKYYKIIQCNDFDEFWTDSDVLDLYRFVKERFESTSLEGYDRLLWEDLITLFKPSEENEI
ncbi:hypothetical protein Tco_1326190 [Tanacetum coccineum]